MDYKSSLNGAWLRHVTHFNFLGLIHISGMAEASVVKLSTQVGYIKSYQKNEISFPRGAWLWSRNLFKFLVPLRYQFSGDFKFCTLVRQVPV